MESGKAVQPSAGATVVTRQDFDLHVLLIMKAGEKSKSKALLTAYREGSTGLEKRLAK